MEVMTNLIINTAGNIKVILKPDDPEPAAWGERKQYY